MAKIFLSFSVVTSSDIIVVARDMDDLAGEVWRKFYAAPHTQRAETIDDLQPVMHRVEIWTTPDGTTLAARLDYADIDASINTAEVDFEIVTFIVDRGLPLDPEDGDDIYENTDMEGKELVPFKPGFGPLVKGTHFELHPAGGFQLTDGNLFNSGEEWTVLVQNEITTYTPPPSTGGFPTGLVEITADTAFDNSTHLGKLLQVNGSGTIITITISNLSLLTNNGSFAISTHGGTQRYAALQLPSGKYVNVNGTDRNIIWLGKGETVHLFKVGDYLYIVSWTGDMHRVGNVVKADGTAPINGIAESGAWVLKADYPRLFNWYVNNLPLGDIGTGTQDVTPDDANKSKWIIGSTKFWIPDRRDRFERNSDGSRVSGDVQAEEVGPHFHDAGTDTSDSPSFYNRSVVEHVARSWNVGNSNVPTGQHASTDINKNVAGLAYTTENRPKNISVNSYRIY